MGMGRDILIAGAGLFLLLLVGTSLGGFRRLALRLGLNVFLTGAILLVINWTAGFTGFFLPFNLLTLSLGGLLGLPGLAALAAFAII